jgi:hypothetical protein
VHLVRRVWPRTVIVVAEFDAPLLGGSGRTTVGPEGGGVVISMVIVLDVAHP